MYEALSGEIVRRAPTEVVLAVGGVEYLLQVPLSTSRRLPEDGPARLLTHLLVREDQMRLVGFATEEERRLFRALLGVSGVGPQVALGILSAASAGAVVRAVQTGDRAFLQSLKGVGRKTAERLLVELREAFQGWETQGAPPPDTAGPLAEEAVRALGHLGLPAATARKAVAAVLARRDGDLTLEELVRAALASV